MDVSCNDKTSVDMGSVLIYADDTQVYITVLPNELQFIVALLNCCHEQSEIFISLINTKQKFEKLSGLNQHKWLTLVMNSLGQPPQIFQVLKRGDVTMKPSYETNRNMVKHFVYDGHYQWNSLRTSQSVDALIKQNKD